MLSGIVRLRAAMYGKIRGTRTRKLGYLDEVEGEGRFREGSETKGGWTDGYDEKLVGLRDFRASEGKGKGGFGTSFPPICGARMRGRRMIEAKREAKCCRPRRASTPARRNGRR